MTTKRATFQIPATDLNATKAYCQGELDKPMRRFIRGLIRRNVPELRAKYLGATTKTPAAQSFTR